MVTDGNYIFYTEHCVMYINIKSLGTPETNICPLYFNLKINQLINEEEEWSHINNLTSHCEDPEKEK